MRTASRIFFSMTGVLCLAGTVQAQVNQFPEFDPYASVRMARLNDQQPVISPMLEDAGPRAFRPVMRTPVGNGHTPETVTAPQPTPTGAPSSAPTSVYESAAASNWGDDCGAGLPSCCGCNNCCYNNWYFYIGGLTMGRDMPNRFWTTYDTASNPNQLLYFPGAAWGGGVDTRIGYWFGCGCGCGDPCGCNTCGGARYGVEAVYWGAWGLNGSASIYDPTNQLGTVQDVGLVSFGADPVSDWFDSSRSVRLSRDDEFHNVEINFLYMPCCNPDSRFQLIGLAGVRYLRFSEGLEWGTLAGTAPSGARFGDDPTDEAYVNVDVQNNLVGFQLGAFLNWQVCDTWSVFAIPKIGIFGNHVSARNRMATGDGIVATFDDSGNDLNFNNSANVFAMVGSIDVGFTWAFTQHWSLIGGYRVVLATNVALGDNQIPQFFADEAGWREVKTNGDLILHGAFAGLEARF